MKMSTLSRIVRVAENLFRDPSTGRYYGVRKLAGKRKVHLLKTALGEPITDRPLAKRILAGWLAEVEEPQKAPPPAAALVLDDLITKFLASRAFKARRTRDNDECFARIFRRTFQPPAGAHTLRVNAVRTSDLLTWIEGEAVTRKWRHRTYNLCRLWLRQVFDLAAADQLIPLGANPFNPKLLPAKKKQPVFRRVPTWEQFSAIVQSVRESDYQSSRGKSSADFLAFLGLAGVGQAEAAGLKWLDIGAERITFIRRKTNKRFFAPIYHWLKPLVDRLRTERTNADAEAPVFTIYDAGIALERACKRLKFPHFTQRNLRAMCIKHLYDAGVPVKRIALWQGHSDGGKLIQEVYTEVFSDNDAAAEEADLAKVLAQSQYPKIVHFANPAALPQSRSHVRLAL
jgi:integrase